jgi:ParB-like nuclease domain
MRVLQDKQQQPILKINPEYEKRIVRASNKEYEKFKHSIKEDGMHYTIAVNQDYVILDGHHRYHVCKELGINPKIQVFRFDNKLLERKFVITSNLKCRHLTDEQKLFYCEELEQIYAALKKTKTRTKTKAS